jgi:hypothetical protein
MANIQKHSKYDKLLNRIELNMQDASLDLPLKHYFSDGMYIREIFIPEGVALTSRVHLTNHPYVLSMGVLEVFTPGERKILASPFTGINEIGTRRMGFAITDCIFTTFHVNPDNCRDIDELEKRLFKYYPNPLIKKI